MDTIYMVELHDYDGHDSWGYFEDRDKANICCEYLNRKYPSDYIGDDDEDEFMWKVVEYGLDTTDYETEIENLKQTEMELKRCKLEREREDILRALVSNQARLDAINEELT